MKPILHRNEKELIRILYREGVPLSIHEIAQMSGMSWITAKKYLEGLEDRNIAESVDKVKRSKFLLNEELLRILIERKNETVQ